MAGRRWKLPKEPTAREREMGEALDQARERGETHAAVAGRLGITVETVKWWSWRIGTRRRAQRRPRAAPKRQGRVDRASQAVPVAMAKLPEPSPAVGAISNWVGIPSSWRRRRARSSPTSNCTALYSEPRFRRMESI